MDVLVYFAIVELIVSKQVIADTYSVTLSTEQHINVVDNKFLSFTIDPKYLFSSSKKYKTKECVCMASSLTPAYIQIAGKSTASMMFRNSTISIDAGREAVDTRSELLSTSRLRKPKKLSVSHRQWEKFVKWAKVTGFELVFGLNNEEKTSSGMWDPNTALQILTSAEKAGIGDIFWQLGYECHNQTIEEYLNDLETLNVIVDTFPSGKTKQWRVVAGDVTHCLQSDSKSDFKDYVTLSNDMFDAIMLNGNSSSQELDRMSEKDRYKLLKLLSTSETPLWLTEHNQIQGELERAADWMTSLGFSARNGFSVHYRELLERELYEPTLSFYMALLFKNLVGERVLNVDIEAFQAILFGHCTSLRHKPVPGAVTFFGVNMDDEPARFSINMSKREEGGDIMQFILGNDRSGNIVVNGKGMFYEGDIKPVVKRVRPYKTLIINLPAKSFGFWVLANTKVEACYDKSDNEEENSDEAVIVKESDENSIKIKRSVYSDTLSEQENKKDDDLYVEIDEEPFSETQYENEALFKRIENMNKKLKAVHGLFKNNNVTVDSEVKKTRRHVSIDHDHSSKLMKKKYSKASSKINDEPSESKLSDKLRKQTENIRRKRARQLLRKYKKQTNDQNKPSSIDSIKIEKSGNDKKYKSRKVIPRKHLIKLGENRLIRQRRSTNSITKYIDEEILPAKLIDLESAEKFRNGILNKIKKLTKLSSDTESSTEYNEHEESAERIKIVKTKVKDDSSELKVSNKTNPGLVKGTLQDILMLLSDLNKQLNKFWNTVTVVE